MSSTFDGLYIAKSGVQTARTNLNVTGQNIANANTDGYTRQRVDQSAIPPLALTCYMLPPAP
jgi:flagellar hook-associated protein 1